jgi:hypothetical protein
MRPRFSFQLGALIVFAAMAGPSFVARAEQPHPPPRAKPQIIYHLPRTSSSAATLHSQAKNESHSRPNDNGMPPSLQMSRGPTNEAAPRARQEQAAAKPDISPPRKIKRPKFQSQQRQMRMRGPSKGRGPGASRGKSGKK